MTTLALFIAFAGFIIGLGAVTVIDLHGFLGRTSAYWTEATTRTHKVTKPLIWIGITLVGIGWLLFYRAYPYGTTQMIHRISFVLMILNGIFLTFSVSPFLLKREKEGKQRELLPASWQIKITFSFIISWLLWWGNLLLFVSFIAHHMS